MKTTSRPRGTLSAIAVATLYVGLVLGAPLLARATAREPEIEPVRSRPGVAHSQRRRDAALAPTRPSSGARAVTDSTRSMPPALAFAT